MKNLTKLIAMSFLTIFVSVNPASSWTYVSEVTSQERTAFLDLRGKKVTLDPGHGWSDSWSGAAANGMLEKDITLDIANKVKPLLEQYGVEVTMTRNGDEPNLRLSNAANRANIYNADIVVSIHVNGGGGTGTESCYQLTSTGEQSFTLASLLTQEISSQLNLKNRGSFPEHTPDRCDRYKTTMWTKLYIHDTNSPAAIIETAFIDGSQDNDVKKLREQHQDFAKAISDAVVKYFSGSVNPPIKTLPDPNVSYTYTINPPGVALTGTQVQATVGATDIASNRIVKSVDMEVNGKVIQTLPGNGGSLTWNTNGLSPGNYTIRFHAVLDNWSGSVNTSEPTYTLAPIPQPGPSKPAPPQLLSPDNNSPLSQDITFRWESNVAPPIEFYLEIQGGPYGTRTFWGIRDKFYNFKETSPGTYSWRVGVRNASGESDWSETRTFTIQQPASTISLAQPGPKPWDVSWAQGIDRGTLAQRIDSLIANRQPRSGMLGQGSTIVKYSLESINGNPAGVNPAFALAMFMKEAEFSKPGTPAYNNNNPGNIQCSSSLSERQGR